MDCLASHHTSHIQLNCTIQCSTCYLMDQTMLDMMLFTQAGKKPWCFPLLRHFLQAPVNEVTLYYRTGWKQAYLHCNLDSKGWTNVPGGSSITFCT